MRSSDTAPRVPPVSGPNPPPCRAVETAMGAAAVPQLSSTTWRPYLRDAEDAAVVSGSLGAVISAAAALGAAADPMRPSTTALLEGVAKPSSLVLPTSDRSFKRLSLALRMVVMSGTTQEIKHRAKNTPFSKKQIKTINRDVLSVFSRINCEQLTHPLTRLLASPGNGQTVGRSRLSKRPW